MLYIPKSVVDEVTSKTNEATRDRVCRRHLGNAVVDQTQEAGVDGVGQEQTSRTTLVETATDTDEESSSNGAANGHELDLSVSEAAVEVIGVLDNLALIVAFCAGEGFRRDILADLLVVLERGHGWSNECEGD